MSDQTFIGFTKVSLPYGWLGNMSPHPIKDSDGKIWKTCEAFFQASRFNDPVVIDEIWKSPSPMGAKFVAKKYAHLMIHEPRGVLDLDNMAVCINLKITQHPEIQKALLDTGDSVIYENVESRQNKPGALFWGAVLQNGKLVGENWLGQIWMKYRMAAVWDN